MRRVWFAVAINLVIPGGGLIVLRREWLGFAISILFVVLTQIAIFGLLIVPLDLPRWAVVVALAGMAGVWGLSQWLVVVRGRLVASPELESELCDLRVNILADMERVGDTVGAKVVGNWLDAAKQALSPDAGREVAELRAYREAAEPLVSTITSYAHRFRDALVTWRDEAERAHDAAKRSFFTGLLAALDAHEGADDVQVAHE